MLKLNIPSWLVVLLGLIGGLLEYLNQASFHLQQPWNQLITFGLYVIAVVGVSPLVHNAFRNALHLSTQLATFITVIAAITATAITTFSMGQVTKGLLEGILAFLAFVGFGPSESIVPTPVSITPAK